ncbi:L,D-transpeptidase family protein [Acrocarpospora corrugata]|uniref:L,D-transpeptidase family protein n=1 Tax=Acrocarpospora corrugata TaxID=35763 RepID=UPI0012D3389B|nr:L,D-transpeptidase family protein [Acrocarpospora corrugata]
MRARRRHLATAALLSAVAVALTGCAVTGAEQARPAAVSLDSGAVRLVAASVPAPFTAPNKTLKLGAKGAAVKALQTRLKELRYLPGKIDGRYGGTTQAAVWAFQKINGLKPTSTITARTWNALEQPAEPRILVPNGKPDRAEVNLTKQVMVLYRGGQVRLITHISSGSGVPYVEYAMWNGERQKFTGDARTPTGNFKTTWRRSGWHKSYLGQLYNPIFFNGGIAFHGAQSVPLYPASHGCVRLPMHVAEILPGQLGTGVPVHVKGKFAR